MHELDLPRLAQMESYYGKHPPLHLMVAAYLGIKPAQAAPAVIADELDDDQYGHLLANMPLSEPPKFMTAEEYLAKKKGLENGG